MDTTGTADLSLDAIPDHDLFTTDDESFIDAESPDDEDFNNSGHGSDASPSTPNPGDDMSDNEDTDWEDDDEENEEDEELREINQDTANEDLQSHLLLEQPKSPEAGYSEPSSAQPPATHEQLLNDQPGTRALRQDEEHRIDSAVTALSESFKQNQSRVRHRKLYSDLKITADKIRSHKRAKKHSASEKRAGKWLAKATDNLLSKVAESKDSEIMANNYQEPLEAIMSNDDAIADFRLICDHVWLPVFKHFAGKLTEDPESVTQFFTALASPRYRKTQKWSAGRQMIYGWLFEDPHRRVTWQALLRAFYGGSTNDAFRRKKEYNQRWPIRKRKKGELYVYKKMVLYRKRTAIVSADCSKLDRWPKIQDLVMCTNETVFISLFKGYAGEANPNLNWKYDPVKSDLLQTAIRENIPDLPKIPLRGLNRCLPVSQGCRIRRWTRPQVNLLKQMHAELKEGEPMTAKEFVAKVQQKMWRKFRVLRSYETIRRIGIRLDLPTTWARQARNLFAQHKIFHEHFTEIEPLLEITIEELAGSGEEVQAVTFQRTVQATLGLDLPYRVAIYQVRRMRRSHEIGRGDGNDRKMDNRRWRVDQLESILSYLEALDPKEFRGSGSAHEIKDLFQRQGMDISIGDCHSVMVAYGNMTLLPTGYSFTGKKKMLDEAIENVKAKRDRALQNAEGVYVAPRPSTPLGSARLIGPGESAVLIQVAFEFIAVVFAGLKPAELGLDWTPVSWADSAKEAAKRLNEKYPQGYQDGENLTERQCELRLISFRKKAKNVSGMRTLTRTHYTGLFVREVTDHLVAKLMVALEKKEITREQALGWLLQQEWSITVKVPKKRTKAEVDASEDSDDSDIVPKPKRKSAKSFAKSTNSDEGEHLDSVIVSGRASRKSSGPIARSNAVPEAINPPSAVKKSAPAFSAPLTMPTSPVLRSARPKRKAAGTVTSYYLDPDWEKEASEDGDDEADRAVLQPTSANVPKKIKTQK